MTDIEAIQSQIAKLSAKADLLVASGAPLEDVEAINHQIQELDFEVFAATGELKEMFMYEPPLPASELAA